MRQSCKQRRINIFLWAAPWILLPLDRVRMFLVFMLCVSRFQWYIYTWLDLLPPLSSCNLSACHMHVVTACILYVLSHISAHTHMHALNDRLYGEIMYENITAHVPICRHRFSLCSLYCAQVKQDGNDFSPTESLSACERHVFLPGHSITVLTPINRLHSYGQFIALSSTNLHVFRLWEETETPRGNPCRHRENKVHTERVLSRFRFRPSDSVNDRSTHCYSQVFRKYSPSYWLLFHTVFHAFLISKLISVYRNVTSHMLMRFQSVECFLFIIPVL